MSKVKIASIIYAIGIIIGALFFDVWGAETTPQKTISVFIWTIQRLSSVVLFQHPKYQKIKPQ